MSFTIFAPLRLLIPLNRTVSLFFPALMREEERMKVRVLTGVSMKRLNV